MIGIVQGRLTYSGEALQSFPKNPYKEFKSAALAKIDFIEFFAERKINKLNPIWSNKGINKYKKYAKENKIKIYSFVDDYFISHKILEKKSLSYALKMIERVSLLGIKKYAIPLYKKSVVNEENLEMVAANLKKISQKSSKYKIQLLIESNMSVDMFKKLKKRVVSKNLYFLYDTGNRFLIKKDNSDILLFGKDIKHVHLKDRNSSFKNVIIGEGKVNFKAIFKNLKKIGYKQSFTIESRRGKNIIHDIANSREYFQKLEQTLHNV